MEQQSTTWISPAGGALLVLGFFLPWVDVSCMGVRRSISGIELAQKGETALFLLPILGGLVLLLAARMQHHPQYRTFLIFSGLAAGGLVVYEMHPFVTGVDTGFGRMKASQLGLSINIGWILTILGAGMVLVGGLQTPIAERRLEESSA
jgi:hypothetical protein